MDTQILVEYLVTRYGDVLSITSIPASAEGLLEVTTQVGDIYLAQPELSESWAKPLAEYFLVDQLTAEVMALPQRVTVDGDTYDMGKFHDRLAARLAWLRRRLGWILDADLPDDDGIGKVVTVTTSFLTGGSPSGGATW